MQGQGKHCGMGLLFGVDYTHTLCTNICYYIDMKHSRGVCAASMCVCNELMNVNATLHYGYSRNQRLTSNYNIFLIELNTFQ